MTETSGSAPKKKSKKKQAESKDGEAAELIKQKAGKGNHKLNQQLHRVRVFNLREETLGLDPNNFARKLKFFNGRDSRDRTKLMRSNSHRQELFKG